MGKVTADISMSLDGFVAGPNDSPEQGLGEGGERLHQWLYDLASWRQRHSLAGGKTNPDSEILDEAFRNSGAIVMGRRMFDLAEVPWGDNPPFHVPVFVVTHRSKNTLVKQGGTTFTFVTDGIASAFKQAQAAARDRDISIGGGASIIQQAMQHGLVDEIQIHIVPVLLGGGVRLFDHMSTDHIELEKTRVIDSPGVTHVKFRVVK